MKLNSINLVLAVAPLGIHLATAKPCSPKPVCKELSLPITATANNTLLPAYPNSTEPGVLYKYLGTFNASELPKNTVTGTFNISALYCEPMVNVQGREGTIQLLLHGLTGIKEYWNGQAFPNPTFEGQYSWMHHAASQGYATLAIDNLGNGLSSHPDPVQVVQTPMQLSVIFGILTGMRVGSLPGISPKYNKMIMATHSYGSVLGRLISSIPHPSKPDGFILTAAAKDLTGLRSFLGLVQARAASVVDSRFPTLPPAYLSTTTSIRESIYGPDGSFDPEMAAWDAQIPHVFTAGEVALSAPSGCVGIRGADCGIGPGSHVEETRSLFPNASNIAAYVVDRSGHNPNTHYCAGEMFGAAHSWLQSVGF